MCRMRRALKATLFRVFLLSVLILGVEAGARAVYFAKRGTFSHLFARKGLDYIRPIIPYESDSAKVSVEEKGDFLIKNGYYTYNPRIGWLEKEDVRINNLGFRGDDISGKKKAKRIWCLGGSTTFGYYTRRPYPEMLEDFLKEKGSDCEVINGGMNAANAQHIYNMLRDEEFVGRI